MSDQLDLGLNQSERYETSATLSRCGTYRYTLLRRWADGPCLRWVMLNPSTADAAVDDPTIRRVVRFSRDAGYSAAVVANLYALRSTDPAALGQHKAPVGPENDGTLRALVRAAGADGWRHDITPVIVAAWGATAPAARVAEVLAGPLADIRLRCLGTTKTGQPRHPLYVRADRPLIPFDPPPGLPAVTTGPPL